MPWTLAADGSDREPIEVIPGPTITIGRADHSTISFPADDWMSSLHFAIFVSSGKLRMQNLSHTNGTQVNDQRTESAPLKPGDRITAGRTTFVVGGPAPSPYPAQARFGGWGLETIPEGWQPIEDVGFQFSAKQGFRATITAVEEPLPEGKTLASYVEAQAEMIRSRLPGATIDGPVENRLRGADSALALSVSSPAPGGGGGTVVQRQIYASAQGIAGIFTATVLDLNGDPLRETIANVVRGLSYFQG